MSAALLTVPRYSADNHRRTTAQARATVEHITPAVRQRAARRLRDALARRTLRRSKLAAALSGGDAGLADLMRAHAALPALPAATRQDFTALAPQPVAAEARSKVLAWIQSALAMGMIEPIELQALTETGFDANSVRRLIVESFNRYAQAIADTVPRSAWEAEQVCMPLTVMPAVLASLAGEPLPEEGPAQVDASLGLFIGLDDGPVFVLPSAAGEDEAFYRAYTTAWDEIAEATRTGLMMRCADTWPCFMGYFDEQLTDLTLLATRRDGGWHFDDAACDMIENELGFNLRDEDMRARMSAHMDYRQRRAGMKPLRPDSAAYKAWAKKAPDHQRALVEYLRSLATNLIARQEGNRKDWAHYSETMPVCVAVIDRDHGLDYFVDETLNQIGAEEYVCEVIQAAKAAQLPALVRSVLLEVATIHAAANALYDYQSRYRPQA